MICMSASRETISHPQLQCCQNKKRHAASKVTMLSMGSLELLLRASVFTLLDLNGMSGTMLPREVLGASLSGPVSCSW